MSESDCELKLIVAAALQSLVSSGKLSPPITSLRLLTRVIAARNHDLAPKLRLTDLLRFESILEDLSRSWDNGSIVLSRDGGTLSIVEISLSSPGYSRKRKRVIDEDADSAAGDENSDEQENSSELPPSNGAPSTLRSLSNELKEVYAILQKGTAKGRLLAEQVCYCCP